MSGSYPGSRASLSQPINRQFASLSVSPNSSPSPSNSSSFTLASQLPSGWEARQDRTGRLYFVNHISKSTQWDDPRPLPAGWEMKFDEKLKRRYFIDHNTKSTTWNDPRPAFILPSAAKPIPLQYQPAAANLFGDATKAALAQLEGMNSAAAVNNNGNEQKASTQEVNWYKDVLQMALIDKALTSDEERLLAAVRAKLHVSPAQHTQVLTEMGWSEAEFDESKNKEDPYKKECLICLDAEASWIILDCYHLSLCESCAHGYELKMKDEQQSCPKCRAPIKLIHKTY
jgi:hypothetical protein